uniref:Ankyrin repeat protein n=1 Tax=Pithovirus LCPAC304 TaxID=2506594 RepID=A0A481Z9C5_9VIRU|nr:MAG: ankyrin repeat protein [Pithovirus LCPAC304]
MEAGSHLSEEVGARLNRILEENPTVDMLKELPPEIQLHMAVQMRYPDVVRFCATSTEAERVCSTDYFWKLKSEHDFPDKSVGSEGKRRETYKQYWQDAQEKFLECARLGHTECIESSLQLGIDPNFQNKFGETALLWAASYRHRDIVRLLLEYGAKPDIRSVTGRTALGVSIEHDRLRWEWSPGDIRIIALLLEHGANPDISNKLGNTALINASHVADIDIVRLLLEHNANPNLPNKRGNTALIEASGDSFVEHTDIVRLLLEHGAKPDLQIRNGWTAIKVASYDGYIETVRLLLNAGADPQGALILASNQQHADIVALLSDKS